MIKDWDNIPDNSIAVSPEGGDSLNASFTYKYNAWRSLNFAIPKSAVDYLYMRFQGDDDPWKYPSSWRKIPVLTVSGSLCYNMTESEAWNKAIEVYNPHMKESDNIIFRLGRSADNKRNAYFGYIFNAEDPKVIIGIQGLNDFMVMGQQNISTRLPIIADNVKEDNETRLQQVETSLGVLEPYVAIVDNVKLRQENHLSLYGTETFHTGTDIITNANITSSLSVNGTISSTNVSYDNETRLQQVETRLSAIEAKLQELEALIS